MEKIIETQLIKLKEILDLPQHCNNIRMDIKIYYDSVNKKGLNGVKIFKTTLPEVSPEEVYNYV